MKNQRDISLRTLLIVPFVLQVVGITSLVGYLSYRSGQQAVENLADQLMDETGSRIQQNLDRYLTLPNQLTQINAALVHQGHLDGLDLAMIEQHYVQQMQILPRLSTLSIANQSGEFLSVERPQADGLIIRRLDADSPDRAFYRYRADDQGQNLSLQEVRHNYDPQHDPPNDPWYARAQKSKSGIWTLAVTLAQGEDRPILHLVRFLPFYDDHNQFQGVLGASVYLTQIGDFLHSLNTGEAGQVFLIERNGLLIATSTGEVPFNSQTGQTLAQNVAVHHRRLPAVESQNPLTRATVQMLLAQSVPLDQITQPQHQQLSVNHNRYFVEVMPLGGELDWLVVVVLSRSALMAEIQQNIRQTALLCVLALITSLGFGWWLVRYISRRLQDLNLATQQYASGGQRPSIPADGLAIREIKVLEQAFQQMMVELDTRTHQTKALQADYARTLERQVAERTCSLNQITAGFKEAQRIAQLGSWEFDLITQTITWSEELFRIFGLDPDQAAPSYEDYLQRLHPDDRPQLQQVVREAMVHGTAYEVEHRIIRPNGSIRILHGRGEALRNDQGEVVKLVGTGLDITERKHLELALQGSQQKLSQVLDTAIAGLIRLRLYPDGAVQYDYISPHCENAFGYSLAELTANVGLWQSRVHPEDWQTIVQPMLQQVLKLEGTATYTIEYRFRRKDDSIGWILANCWAQWSEATGCWHLTVVDTDITDRKQIEIALKQSETRFLEISESSPANIYVLVRRKDGSMYFEHMSRAIEVIHEHTVEEILADASLLLDRVHPDDRADYTAAVQRSLETLEPFQHEWRVINPSGQIKWLQGRSRPKLRDHDEVAWYGVVIDVTDRKAAELALQASEARYRAIFDQVAVGINQADISGKYISTNQTFGAMLGYTPAEILQLTYRDLTHPDDLAEFQSVYTQLVMGKIPIAVHQKRYRHRDGHYIWTQVALSPLRDLQGQIVSDVAVVVNIDAQKRAELALQEQENQLAQVLDSALAAISRFRVTADGQWQTIHISKGAEVLAGYTPEELMADEYLWVSRTYPGDWEAIQEALIADIFAERQGIYEYRIFDRQERLRWISQTNRSRYSPSESCWYVTAVSVDITQRKQVEIQLRESETELRSLFMAMEDVVLVLDRQGYYLKVVSTNPKLLYRSAAELLGEPLQRFFSAEQSMKFLKLIHRVLDTQTTQQTEYSLILDGGVHWFSANCSPLDSNRVLLVARDISDRKRAEMALQESESILRQVTENLPMFFGLRPLDYSYWLYVNPVYQEITGRSIDTLYTDPKSWQHLVHPDDLDQVLANQVLPDHPHPVLNEFRVFKSKNDIRWVRSVEFPVYNHQGKPYRVVAFAEDVTEQTQAESTLRESEERFRRAFDDAPISMALVTLDGYFLQVNQALSNFLGYESQELLTIPITSISYPEDMVQDQTLVRAVLAGELSAYQLEKRYFHKQGHLVYGLLSVSLVRDGQNRPLYFVAQILDISERHKIDRMKRDFISIVSHELRTPLTSIRGSLGILETGVLNNRPHKSQHMLQVALDNTNRLIRLVNDILDLERLESGHIDLIMESCQVADLMQQAVDSLDAIATEAHITLHLTPLKARVVAAPDALIQTLTNLLSNAIKFSDPGCTVWLNAEMVTAQSALTQSQFATGKHFAEVDCQSNPVGPLLDTSVDFAANPAASPTYILFSVRDQGRGIPPEKIEVIFDRFQQVDASDSRQKGGTGLGLAICKTIVEQHGGTLWVDSKLDVGSTFYFTLPIKPT